MNNSLQAMRYGHAVRTELPHEAAVERVKALLKDEGFGVLCDIDVAKTMHEKLGVAFRPYRILGACNPTLAHQALSADSQLGLLLPCNVVVQAEHGHTSVSAIDTRALLSLAKDPALVPIAAEVSARLDRVLEKMSGVLR